MVMCDKVAFLQRSGELIKSIVERELFLNILENE